MDPVLSAAARALSMFDPLEALRGIALRDDPPALALRGVAMAQLGEFRRARKLLARAARGFESAPAARARCLAADAEIALACRDLARAGRGLETAAALLDSEGDDENATFARLLLVRRSILLGEIDDAERLRRTLSLERVSPRIAALAALVDVDIAVRRFRSSDARRALERARAAAREARIASIDREVDRASAELDAKVARLVDAGRERAIDLGEFERLARSEHLIVDGCRRELRSGSEVVPLASRPVLFALARVLGEASPLAVDRTTLIGAVFGGKSATDSYRARLRVEIGRLRGLAAKLADVRATRSGYQLGAREGSRVLVLLPPEPGEAGALLALLASGESWSTSALATALGRSQRSVQRSLGGLLESGRVQSVGSGRARRWVAPPPAGFATTLLLSARGGRG